MYIEKRQENRVLLSLPVRLKVFDLERLPEEVADNHLDQKAEIQDLSLGGLQILTARKLDVGDIVELEMTIPEKGIVRSVAKVVWCREIAPGGSWHCGIHFIPVFKEDLANLMEFFKMENGN
jgi:hypothetical protein